MVQSIGNHMIKSPFMGDIGQSLREAQDSMRECGIRHLPVTEDERLVGIVSERDLREALSLPQADQLRLGDVMKRDVFVIGRSTPLRDVVRTMQEQKIGSAVVVDSERNCVGIFTTIDALGILADILDESDTEADELFVDEYVEFWDSPSQAFI